MWVHNNVPPVKKCSGLNQERNLHRSSTVYKSKQSRTDLNKYVAGFDVKDNRRWTLSLEEALLWIMDSNFSQNLSDGLNLKSLNDGFVSAFVFSRH